VAKKIEHGVCFRIKPENFRFSQAQAKAINRAGGIVGYVRRGVELPSLDLIREFQNVLKNFCEDPTQSVRYDNIIFRGIPCVAFYNPNTRQIVLFHKETKVYIMAYKLARRHVDDFLEKGVLGN